MLAAGVGDMASRARPFSCVWLGGCLARRAGGGGQELNDVGDFSMCEDSVSGFRG